jgi:hypothetical protein
LAYSLMAGTRVSIRKACSCRGVGFRVFVFRLLAGAVLLVELLSIVDLLVLVLFSEPCDCC